MGTTMIVAPIGEYDEEMDEEGREAAAADIAGLNEILEEAGLPEYHDPQLAEGEGSPYWTHNFTASGLDAFFAMIHALGDQEEEIPGVDWDILSHPEIFPVLYLPSEFEGVVEVNAPGDEAEHDHDHDHSEGDDAEVGDGHACGCGDTGCGEGEEGGGFGLASAHSLKASLEALAAHLGLPLDRFEVDYTGDDPEIAASWDEVFDELEEQGAPCMAISFDDEPMDADGVRDYAAALAEQLGIDPEEILGSLVEKFGSLEEAAIAMGEENDPETMGRRAFATLITYYHASLLALENNVPVRFA